MGGGGGRGERRAECVVVSDVYAIWIEDKVQWRGGSVAEWFACWTQAQKGPGSNRSRDAVGWQS